MTARASRGVRVLLSMKTELACRLPELTLSSSRVTTSVQFEVPFGTAASRTRSNPLSADMRAKIRRDSGESPTMSPTGRTRLIHAT